MDLETRYKKTKCYWCQSPATPSTTPCCVGVLMWRSAVVEDARRWLVENNPDIINFGFGDDGLE